MARRLIDLSMPVHNDMVSFPRVVRPALVMYETWQQFATRIKELYGVVPGSLDFSAQQTYLQPPDEQTDIVHVIKGVIEAETGAIDHYNRIIEETDGVDWVTQDMVIAILRDEEGHKRLFEGFLREYKVEGLA